MAKQQLSAADIAAQSQLQEEQEIQNAFETGITTMRDLISSSSIEFNTDYFRLGQKYGRTLYIYGYPRSLVTGWLSSVINIDEVIDISMFIYPADTTVVMKNLTKKVTQLEASLNINAEKGKVRDPELENAQKNSSASVFISRFTPIRSKNFNLFSTRSKTFLASKWSLRKLQPLSKSRA